MCACLPICGFSPKRLTLMLYCFCNVVTNHVSATAGRNNQIVFLNYWLTFSYDLQLGEENEPKHRKNWSGHDYIVSKKLSIERLPSKTLSAELN